MPFWMLDVNFSKDGFTLSEGNAQEILSLIRRVVINCSAWIRPSRPSPKTN
jgi:hypothetical protein